MMFVKKLKLAAFLLAAFAVFSAAAHAQPRVNNDLKSSPPAETKTETKSTVKPTVKTTRSVKPAKPKTNKVKTGGTNSKMPRNTGGGNTVAVSSETPDQIINRYMNYQQSSGVTTRDWRSVIAQTTKTLQENPNHSTAKAQSLIAQGQIAYNEGSYPSAISYFKSALQILPTSSLPQYSLGKVYLANGQAKAAEQAFKEAIEQNEDFPLAYKGMGDALAAQGENKKATKFYKKATEMSVRKGSLP